MKPTQEIPVHTDLLGKTINLGDSVAYSALNSLYIGTVIKLNPKMIGVQRIGVRDNRKQNKYPTEIVILNPQDVTMHLLKSGVK